MHLLSNIRTALNTFHSSTRGRMFHVSASLDKNKAGRYRVTLRRNRPLTYEMAHKPHEICMRKSWNSWNTSNIKDGNRPMESAIDDAFIRRFMNGTWHDIFVSEIIIKRHHNMVRVAGIIRQCINPSKMYFLLGYSEELLSTYLQCPVKIELQSVRDRADVVYKYI